MNDPLKFLMSPLFLNENRNTSYYRFYYFNAVLVVISSPNPKTEESSAYECGFESYEHGCKS